MATTNFANLQSEQLLAWSKRMWSHARNTSFMNKFVGDSENSMIQRISELSASKQGARAMITLVNDLEGDGVVGDNQLEGHEASLTSSDLVIQLDQHRNAAGNEGRMADQKAVVNFRSQANNKLAYWLADRLDQLAFLTLAGINYNVVNSGGLRSGSSFPDFAFAADVTAPSPRRVGRWNGTTKRFEVGGATSSVTAADTPMWELFVELKALAKTEYVRPIRGTGGKELYHVFLSPQALAKLKLDPTFMQNVRHAAPRSEDNVLFSGGGIMVDGLAFHEYMHVPNTARAVSGAKYGASGTVDGCQILMCGSQALAFADIGDAIWSEEEQDYGNRMSIAVSKIFGLRKPRFYTPYSRTVEDFGVISAYVAQ